MIVSLVIAADEKNGIGKDGKLPWHLPSELKRFKLLTMGHHVIMGRKTFESIKSPLPGRKRLVVSRNTNYFLADAVVKPSLEAALSVAREHGDTEVMVIGGAEVFRAALPLADRFYLTRVHHTFDADTFIPSIDMEQWEVKEEERFDADERNKYPYTIQILEKKKPEVPAQPKA